MTANEEIELKFALDPAALSRLDAQLCAEAGPPDVQTLQSTYYDTPGCALQARGLSLRLRFDGSVWRQTLKTEARDLARRGEWEIEVPAESLDLEALAHVAGAPALDRFDGQLHPVFVTRIERRKWRLIEAGAQIEAAIDGGQVEAGARVAPVGELELELKSGELAALFAVARRLAAREPMGLSFETKAGRGYRLAHNEALGAILAPAPVLRPDMTVETAFSTIGAAGLRLLVGNANSWLAARRPEALHQMRVSARRLRTGFKLFQPLAGDGEHDRLAEALKWLAGQLDAARDLDVFIAESFRPAAERVHDQAGLVELGRRLRQRRAAAYDRAALALASPRYLTLTLDLASRLSSDQPLGARPAGAPEPLAAFAAAALDRLRGQVKRRGRNLERQDVASRHKARIRAKRLRYALEFFGGLYPAHQGRHARMAARLKALQDQLGQLNDLAVAQATALSLAEDPEPPEPGAKARLCLAAGVVVGLRIRAEGRAVKAASEAYDALMAMRPFWRQA